MSLELPAAAVDVDAVGPAAAIEQLAEAGRARRGDRRRADARAGPDALIRVALLLRNGMRLEGVVLDATADAVALWIEPDDVAQVARAEIVAVVRRGQLRAPAIAAPADRAPANRLALRRLALQARPGGAPAIDVDTEPADVQARVALGALVTDVADVLARIEADELGRQALVSVATVRLGLAAAADASRAGEVVAVVTPLDLARRWDIERLRAGIEALL